MHQYNFGKLEIWKNLKSLVLKIYSIPPSFSIEEKFGIIDQMRRAELSINSNRAKDFSINSDKG